MGFQKQPQSFFRGVTIYFQTNFFDLNQDQTQPPGAFVNIEYFDLNGNPQTIDVPMTAPSGLVTTWTTLWDSRGANPGAVYWSIHSTGPGVPYAVEDGSFMLTANNANLPTF